MLLFYEGEGGRAPVGLLHLTAGAFTLAPPKAHRKGFPPAVRVDPIPDKTTGRVAKGRRLSVTELAAFAQASPREPAAADQPTEAAAAGGRRRGRRGSVTELHPELDGSAKCVLAAESAEELQAWTGGPLQNSRPC